MACNHLTRTAAPADKIFAHGELRFRKIGTKSAMSKNGLIPFPKDDKEGYILAHSEHGHHHVADGDVECLQEPVEVRDQVLNKVFLFTGSQGAEIKHLKEGECTHGTWVLEPDSVYVAKNAREYTPEGLRRSAD